ncbi:hypothetical protein [Natrinema versiforme]|uniref:Uncharacterized protein n=1 Tax=Natrinema versiforme JCM 10478 TaxID=1227496 RepID=L9XSA8_9EURY|nr:hypothetical protein [Natrinema versiforme]ELY63493.1 hypothetical protein C489_18816 [Natrinema versiforme JCM 10478]
MDHQFINQMYLAADPATDGRENVVHISSQGAESPDYPCGALDLRPRSLTLSQVSDPGSITYEDYKGEQATYKVPDDVFLILRTADGTLHVLRRKVDTDTTGEWRTRDVSNEFTRDGWRSVAIDDSDADESTDRIAAALETIGQYILDLRTQATFADVRAEFGAEAEVLAVAVGNGSVDGVVSDAYFHNLQVADQDYVIPAMLVLEADIVGADHVTATLSAANAPADVGPTVADIAAESVRMAEYLPFAPSYPGSTAAETSVPAQTMGVSSEQGVTVEFDADQVSALETNTVYIHGEFASQEPHTFVAIDELASN